jgi:hypothetical protein
MRLKSMLTAVVLMATLAANEALADDYCSLTVNPSSIIYPGQFFSYTVNINPSPPWPSPLPPGGQPSPPFRVVFYGLKNGVPDIPQSGETYPGTFWYGTSQLTGYQNPPSGGFAGTYHRYAVIYAYNYPGSVYCVTNIVRVSLQ